MTMIIKAALVGIAVVLGIASGFLFKKDDNVVEEYCEEIVKEETGIDVDLTPGSPEK